MSAVCIPRVLCFSGCWIEGSILAWSWHLCHAATVTDTCCRPHSPHHRTQHCCLWCLDSSVLLKVQTHKSTSTATSASTTQEALQDLPKYYISRHLHLEGEMTWAMQGRPRQKSSRRFIRKAPRAPGIPACIKRTPCSCN